MPKADYELIEKLESELLTVGLSGEEFYLKPINFQKCTGRCWAVEYDDKIILFNSPLDDQGRKRLTKEYGEEAALFIEKMFTEREVV